MPLNKETKPIFQLSSLSSPIYQQDVLTERIVLLFLSLPPLSLSLYLSLYISFYQRSLLTSTRAGILCLH